MGSEIKLEKSDFMRVLIKPFTAWGWKFSEEQADMLYPMLTQFELEAIEIAGRHLLKNNKFKPRPAEIIEACQKFATTRHASAGAEKFQRDQEAKADLICQESYNYTANFMLRDPVAQEAKLQGWAKELEEFVKHTANSMLQMKYFNGNGPIMFGWISVMMPLDYQREYKELLQKQAKRIQQTQQFDVITALPHRLKEYWINNAVRVEAA